MTNQKINYPEVIAQATAALATTEVTHKDIVLKVGDYRNYHSYSAGPEDRAGEIIKTALNSIFEIYRAGGDYDEVAGNALEEFARDNGIARICGVKE